jgi:hypothetical protein
VTPDARRAVAFVAGQLVTGKRRAIYDYEKGAYAHFSGTVGPQIRIYDHQASAHITGSSKQLYHHGLSAHISLDISGKNFKGYDYGSSSHFSGKVRYNNITLYDFAAAKYFQFLLA